MAIHESKVLCVNLGCGDAIARPIEQDQDWINLDKTLHKGVDLVADLEEGLPFEDNSVDLLYASHVLEHIRKFPQLMAECCRVLKPRGVLALRVPDASCRAAKADPTHVWQFVPETWTHFNMESETGFDTLGMRGLGLIMKWCEVVRWRREGLDDGRPGAFFTEIIVDYEKDGPFHEWERKLIDMSGESPSVVCSEYRESLRKVVEEKVDEPGEFWECGVYTGGTARILVRAIETSTDETKKTVRLFDTWEGMPTPSEFDLHKEADFHLGPVNLEKIKSFVGEAEWIHYIKGEFPGTFQGLEDVTIALAHIDCDLYESVKACCEFIWPRLSPKGVMVFDDYAHPNTPGAAKAVDDFFRDKPHVLRQLAENRQLAAWKELENEGAVN